MSFTAIEKADFICVCMCVCFTSFTPELAGIPFFLKLGKPETKRRLTHFPIVSKGVGLCVSFTCCIMFDFTNTPTTGGGGSEPRSPDKLAHRPQMSRFHYCRLEPIKTCFSCRVLWRGENDLVHSPCRQQPVTGSVFVDQWKTRTLSRAHSSTNQSIDWLALSRSMKEKSKCSNLRDLILLTNTTNKKQTGVNITSVLEVTITQQINIGSGRRSEALQPVIITLIRGSLEFRTPRTTVLKTNESWT